MLIRRDEYDFSKVRSRKNPYASRLKQPVTISLGEDVITYFKSMAKDTGASYQGLMSLYLRDCAATQEDRDKPALKGIKYVSWPASKNY